MFPGQSPYRENLWCGRMHPAKVTGVRLKDRSEGSGTHGNSGPSLRAGFLVRAGHPILPYEHAKRHTVGEVLYRTEGVLWIQEKLAYSVRDSPFGCSFFYCAVSYSRNPRGGVLSGGVTLF